MKILKVLKFWEDAVIGGTIQAVTNLFNSYKQKAPGRDPHYWLASAFSDRRGYGPGKDAGPIIPFTRTTIFSVLGDCAPLALAYYFLSKEMPHTVPKFEKKWEKLLQPAEDLIARREFLTTWEKVNSWTRENVPGMQQAVKEIEKAHWPVMDFPQVGLFYSSFN